METKQLLKLVQSLQPCLGKAANLLGFVATVILPVILLIATFALIKQKSPEIVHQSLQRPLQRGKLCDIQAEAAGEVTKESEFPGGWWISEELFQTEKRAIFTKKPVGLAHVSMFQRPGEYVTVNHPSGYPLFLVLGRDWVLRGFHNVCRHRAYPVVSTKTSGCAFVLGCMYHGWSYDLRGNLIKAPKFEAVEGFNKSANSLFEVNVMVGDSGVVFVDVGSKPGRMAHIHGSRLGQSLVESWEVEGRFNWKLAESADAFSVPTFTSGSHSMSLLKMITSKLGISIGRWHTKPSILTDIVDVPQQKSTLFITVYPASAEKCITTISLYTTSSSPTPPAILGAIKDEISRCISGLEKIHCRIKSSITAPATAPHLVFLGWLRSHQRLEHAAGRRISLASETFEASISELDPADNLCRELETVAAQHGNRERKRREEAFAW